MRLEFHTERNVEADKLEKSETWLRPPSAQGINICTARSSS